MAKEAALVGLAWTLLAVVRMPSLLAAPARRLWGDVQTDLLTVPWTLWHVAWDAVYMRQLGGHTASVDWPDGGTFWPASPLESLLLTPVTLLLGAVVAANLLQLLHVGLAGGCAYALLRRVTGSWVAALAVSPLLALSPVLLCSAHNGNPEAAQLYWLPLAGLAAYEAMRSPRARLVPVASLLLAFSVISNVYVGLATGVAVLGMLALSGVRRWGRATAIVSLGVVLASPVLLWAASISMGRGSILQRDAEVVARQRLLEGQASLLELVRPGIGRSLGPDLEPTAFLSCASVGLVAALLALGVLLLGGRQGVRLRVRLVGLGLAIVGALMALGPRLKLLPGAEGTAIPLPWLALDWAPPFSQLIELWRFSMLMGFGAALLIGSWLAGRSRWLALGVGLALILEAALLTPGPRAWQVAHTAHSELPELLEDLELGAVMHLPARQGYWPLYFQTLHHRPVGSSTEQPLDMDLFGRLAQPSWSLETLHAFGRERNFRWLLVHVRPDMEALQDVQAIATQLDRAGLVLRRSDELLLVDLHAPGPWPQRPFETRARPVAGPGGMRLDTGAAPALYLEP